MPEFLVHMELTIPPETDPETMAKLYADEGEAAKPLLEMGYFERVWREPGTRNHWAIWQVPSADDVHRAYSAFPLFPYMDVTVLPLALNSHDRGAPPVASDAELRRILPERNMP